MITDGTELNSQPTTSTPLPYLVHAVKRLEGEEEEKEESWKYNEDCY